MNNDGSSRYDDLSIAELIEHSVRLGEGQLSRRGALAVQTTRTDDVQRFFVNEPSVTDVLRADATFDLLYSKAFKTLWESVKDQIAEHPRYRLYAHMGVHPDKAVPLEITTLKAWHALACHHLCHIPDDAAFNPREKPLWKLIWAPMSALKHAMPDVADGHSGLIMMHVGKRRVLMAGDLTTGEMRRTLLTVLGLLLPEKGALPLHGAASLGDGQITLFLGPAGTQKTTWAMRCGQLIGERGLAWSEDGLHRLADGCRLHLNASLPISLDDALTFGTLAEELTLGPDRHPVITEPSDSERPVPVHLVLPLSKLQATAESDTRGPSQLVILATDPLGVLPPLARLTKEQALAWYVLGYGNHYGPLEHRQAACDIRCTPGFMDTLLPRSLDEYIYLLEDLLESHQTRCYLINAGWHGGICGLGEPLSSSEESACLTALYHCMDWQPLGAFGLSIPQGHSETAGPWHPQERWADPSGYERQLDTLKQTILTELQSTSDPVRWLAALELS